jgi:hypothetical protein
MLHQWSANQIYGCDQMFSPHTLQHGCIYKEIKNQPTIPSQNYTTIITDPRSQPKTLPKTSALSSSWSQRHLEDTASSRSSFTGWLRIQVVVARLAAPPGRPAWVARLAAPPGHPAWVAPRHCLHRPRSPASSFLAVLPAKVAPSHASPASGVLAVLALKPSRGTPYTGPCWPHVLPSLHLAILGSL